MESQRICGAAACVLLTLCCAQRGLAQGAYVNFEGKQTRPISLSSDGTRLFAVNTPDARLSVFDVTHALNPFLIAEIPVGIEPVSVNARDNNEAWVVCEVSDSVSIVSVSNRMVVDTLSVKDEPADVVFAGGRAFVTESRNNRLAVFDVTNHALLTNLVLSGENPRSLAVNSNGTKVYAAFALSGNRTTIVPADQNPTNQSPINPPMNPALPPPPQVGRIVEATDPAWTNVIRFNMPDNDVAEIDVATMSVSRYFSHVGTVNLAIAAHPVSRDLYVANTEARNLTRFEPNLRGFAVTNRISRINVASGAVTNIDLNVGFHPTNFTHFNLAFDRLLGGSMLSQSDMNAYRDFINTIRFEPNPNQNLDRSMPTNFAGANARAGLSNFVFEPFIGVGTNGLTCNSCHTLPAGSGRFFVTQFFLQESQDFKVPHLRNLYQKTRLNRGTNATSIGGLGFLHDGTFQDIFTFLSQPVFQSISSNTKSNLQAFLLCFDTGTAPAVGSSRTAVSNSVTSVTLSNDWFILESQAVGGTNIDLILKGTIDGVRHGLLYQPGANNYQPDTTNSGPFTRAQLVAKIQAGDTLTLMGVPPGAGQRMGIDRDLDGVLDSDVPRPSLQLVSSGTKAILAWPFSAVGFILEETPSLSAAWRSSTNVAEISNNFNYVTNTLGTGARFFRLRSP